MFPFLKFVVLVLRSVSNRYKPVQGNLATVEMFTDLLVQWFGVILVDTAGLCVNHKKDQSIAHMP